jgi:hypothetical protein
MLADYLYWQYVWAPRWLLGLIWNVQRALLQFFSVKLMVRTLLAHWHKDAMSFRGGTLGELGMTIVWNLISRAIGFGVRVLVLLVWLVVEAVYAGSALLALVLFFAWLPLSVLVFVVGVALLVV